MRNFTLGLVLCCILDLITFVTYANGQLTNQYEYEFFSDVETACISYEQSSQQCFFDFAGEVVGGVNVKPCRFPYLVSIQAPNQYDLSGQTYLHFCGGTLIAPRVVLTAAHCFGNAAVINGGSYVVKDIDPGVMYAALDPFCRHMKGKGRVGISKMYVHGSYGGSAESGNDITLLLLDTEFDDFEGPYANYKGSQTVLENGWSPYLYSVVGWGSVYTQDAQSSKFFQTVKSQQLGFLSHITTEMCNQQIGTSAAVDSTSMVCFVDENTDSCQGDSGGPLLAYDSAISKTEFQNIPATNDIQVGITSWGPDVTCGGGAAILPGVYTNVANYVDWIDEILGDIEAGFSDGAGGVFASIVQTDGDGDDAGSIEYGRTVTGDSIAPRLTELAQIPEECLEDVDPGPCDDRTARYYYNRDRNQCETFVYGGCFGNSNNFMTFSNCQDTCVQ
eukprot:TRINITY_DN7515_c0_g1_i1.p1 TRINITY_DN7515_c0_g1~~TRINITY_DN7515_c0_g1_i1.p1  ORF type:complete len:466 (-),score=46.07 TRINITY_DN7515_c0_g1_i1:503-1840(-)